MKLYNTNLVEQNIILNATIAYSFEENSKPILVKIPTIRDSVEDPNFNMFLSLIYLKMEDYKKMGLMTKVENEGQALIAVIRESREIREQVKPFIERFLLNSVVSVRGVEVDGKTLGAAEIDYFRKIILMSFGVEKVEEVKDDTSKMGAAERAIYERQQETLRRLEQAKKKKEKVHKENGQIDLPKIIAGVMKEFNMTLEEIKDLNYYTLYYLFGYVFKIDHYDFMKKAAASGNLAKNSKITHWLE